MRKAFKKFLKRNKFVLSVMTILLYWYMLFVYFTSKQKIIFYDDGNKEKFLNEQGVIFAFWHNMLALSPAMFKGHRDVYALISPHLDGKILNALVDKFGCKVIVGSSNKNSFGALRSIIEKLSQDANVIVTPDGPKGPVYNVNSGITEIAYKYNKKLIPIVSSTSRCFRLKSWDKLIIPLPFGSIQIIVGSPLVLTDNKVQNHMNLEKDLVNLTKNLIK